MKQNLSWLAWYEETDEEGFYVQGELAFAAERAALKAGGAPDTDEIEFVSIEPESRDEAMVEARVTERFAAWAKSNSDAKGEITEPVENGISNLTYYDGTQ